MTTTTEAKSRTITLTDRPPVKIREDQWPVIAEGNADSYGSNRADYGRYQQALWQGQCDTYVLRVRQHPDGRAIVYGVLDAAISAWHQPAHGESIRGGELLDGASATARIPDAIRRVGEYCRLPNSVIRDCIADLPAVDLD